MKIQNVEVEGIDYNDAPDFCDAVITYAEDETGRPLTDDEINALDGAVAYEHIYLFAIGA